MSTFYVPAINLIGRGVVKEIGPYVKDLGYHKALLVTDKFIESSDILPKVTEPLKEAGVDFVIYSDVEPNPTCKNVNDGVAALKENNCDFIISLGGGSPQDCASCISVIATNGGKPQDYEGLHKSAKKGLPVVAINTTAGTSAEITINYVITDEERKVKMVMVDKNSLALISMSFNNAGLGYVHSMAHQLGAVYKLPHGVCCAMLLPVIERENAKRVPAAFRDVAKALGLQTEGKSDEECAAYAIKEIETLSETVGIPKKLTELGIEEKDFDFEYLSKNALIDACAPGNPFMPTLEETIAFYKELF